MTIAMAVTLSTNGTFKDVAAFVGIGERTLKRWNVERPPRIAFYCDGGANVYLEEDVVAYVAKHYVADHRMSSGEILELVRRQWREHLKVRSVECGSRLVEDLQRRLEALEVRWHMANCKWQSRRRPHDDDEGT
jgi:hypothetical protein